MQADIVTACARHVRIIVYLPNRSDDNVMVPHAMIINSLNFIYTSILPRPFSQFSPLQPDFCPL